MLSVFISTDPLEPDSYELHEVESGLVDFLREQFPTWPETARLYKDAVAVETDVTPTDERSADELEEVEEGTYYVIVYPGDPVTAIIAVVATIALTAAVLLLMPKIPTMGTDIESANNALGNRVNKPRPNSRIPDIFGTVRAIPDLLTVPLLTYEDNVEVEVAVMCLGRGEYDIDKVRDGGTPLSLIAGAGAEFYGPYTSPNSGSPQLVVGAEVTAPFREVLRVNEVNGQELDAPNANRVSGNSSIRFAEPNYIENNGSVDFTEYFGPGDDLTISGATYGSTEVLIDAVTQRMRFHSDKRIEFETFDPSTVFEAGQTLILEHATFAGPHETTGETVYIDVSGRYLIDSVTSTTIQLATS